ncbi:hypothetical protein ACFX13_007929 [Malus domestica]|uniref:F-box domain-containing protein n=1 Tax=Malus domestica TaxID=3750 RepID=A0A498IPP3_MALDO|nr:hypothetical protein DVH24_026926 [Malus domestica]
MGSNSETRRLKENSKPRAGGEDRISRLPDAVLCHILSLIPTKYAVRSSILSNRWKNIWASVPNLDFEDRSNRCIAEKKYKCDTVGFSTFVDRVLSLRDSSIDIKKFRLHWVCSSDDFSRIDGWIQTAVQHNVVELDLLVETDSSDDFIFEFPQCIFSCKTLVALKVYSNCISYSPPTSGCFLNLKTLYVGAEYPDSDSVEKIFSCCPVLEDLTIMGLLGQYEVLNYKISAPELNTLRLNLPVDVGDHDQNHSIFISCPKLENLVIRQDILSSYIFVNVKSLVKASFTLFFHNAENLQPNFDNRAITCLAGISNVQCLSLSAHHFLKGHCLPAFDNLRELKLVLHDCYHWDLLTELLKRSPILEYLVVEYEEDKECVDDYDEHEYLKHVLYSEHRWSTPESVPICLISHLKTITIRGFKGYPHEKKVAKYLLENGKVLNKMTIHNGLYKELTQKRGSTTCQVELV